MEIALIIGVILTIIGIFWLVSMPFRRIAQENTFERMLKDPEVQDLLYIAVARASTRRKKIQLQQRAIQEAHAQPKSKPKGKIARLLAEAEREGERLKESAIEDLRRDLD